MSELMNVIKDRQDKSGVSVERYANMMGLTGGAMYKYLKGQTRRIDSDAARKMAQFYRASGDLEALNAVVSYVTGLDDIKVTTTD